MTRDIFTPPPADSDWTQLHLSRLDRTYRYRIHHDRLRPDDVKETAPGPYRFELEYLDREGRWLPVRFYARRDEIWRIVRPTKPTEASERTEL